MVKSSRPSGPAVEKEGAGANLPLGAEPPARPLTGAFHLPLFLAAALTLTACATTSEPRIEVREVKVPVAVPCAADPGPDVAFVDTPEALRAAKDIWERTKLLLAGRAQRDARLAELKAANTACR